MIRMIQVKSPDHAEDYFKDALSQTGYYINGQEQGGTFQGKIATRLGLTRPATLKIFHDLCRNINPGTKNPLTRRTTENRTVYYDINFHCPKSVSIACLVYGDNNIITAFENSVHETMCEIEADAQTRIRKNGQNENRITGELLWGDFVHFTSRPVNETTAPDPHLHSHCTVFNATWDATEQVFKAVQFQDMKRDMPYYQERFYKRLSDRLLKSGYSIRKTRTAFEIDGIHEHMIALFSKRAIEVNRIAKEMNITDAAKLDRLGAQTRQSKKKALSLTELKQDWLRQWKELNLPFNRITGLFNRPIMLTIPVTPKSCIDAAILQRFERASVTPERRLLAAAYRHSLGSAETTIEEITQAIHQDNRIIRIQDSGKTMCTTQEVLAEEKRMVDLANAGKGCFIPFYSVVPPLTVTGDQADAITHALTSTDAVTIIQGGAGTGKTTTLKELTSHLKQVEINPVFVAPTANASRGELREQGFDNADTVAKFLTDSSMQTAIQNGALIVDEAGLLGVKDMKALLEIISYRNARLILIGDTRQHSSVIRGDALRILNTVAGIKYAEVNKIYRQRQECYRRAVEDLSAGNIQSAFECLDRFKAISELETDLLTEQLVKDYMTAIDRRKTVLVVSPTHRQGEIVTQEIRKALRTKGIIGSKDIQAVRYINLSYTEAEKQDTSMYEVGFTIQFSQNLSGIPRGSIWEVEQASQSEITISNDRDQSLSLPMAKAQHFTVYRKTHIALAIGDTVIVTRGSFDLSGKRLNNGQSLKVASFDGNGNPVLKNTISKIEYRIAIDFGHINHGYTTTSHASQGKTVDEVFICQPASTFPASNMKQFYVSVSRARDKVHIYTDDKIALLDHVSIIGNRQSALELISPDEFSQRIAEQLARLERPSNNEPETSQTEQKPATRVFKPNAPKPVF